MAIQSWMRMCVGVAVLTVTLNQNHQLMGQVASPVEQQTELRTKQPASETVTTPIASEPPRVFPFAAAILPIIAPPDRDAATSVSGTGGTTLSEKSATQIKRLLEDSQKLEKQLKVLFPGSRLFLTPLKEQLVIKGQAGSREEEAAILQIVKSAMSKYFPDDMPSTDPTAPAEQNENFIMDLIHVETVSVSLKVQVVELDHAKMRNLGFDFELPARFPGHTPITNLELNTASLTGLYDNKEIDRFITSLTNAGVAEVVAESALVVQDGHAASFLSGGEFPVPTIIGVGSEDPSTSFRGIGPSLLVRPSVIEKGYLKLEVTPEVSTILSDTSGRELPSLEVRRSTETVKMREGLSFALTTEIERAVHDDAAQIPFLGELPVIGSVFRAKPVMTTRKMLLVITPTVGVAETPENLPQAPQQISEGALPQTSHQLVNHTAEANPAYQLSGNLNQISYRQPQTKWSDLPIPAPVSQPDAVYPVPQTTKWNPQPAWMQAPISRLSHLHNAVASLTAAGLTVQADEVRQEIQKQKLADQRQTLQQKTRELAALQAEVETLRNSLSLTSNGLATHFRLNSLILTSTHEKLQSVGLVPNNTDGNGALTARIPGDTAGTLLEKCKQTAGIKVLGSSTQLAADGERTTWQNGIEVAVPEVVQTEGSSEQKLSTGVRLVGSDIALTPKLRDDGTISLEAVLEFSKTRNQKRGVVQVSGRSVPQIDSRRIRSEMKLTSGQTVLFGMPHMPQDGDEVVVIAITVSTEE